ncbi:hypothetical protein TWF481_000501 [Arthrobotrys musiformis]|uniref:Uncharacterized protein n=1 Tax=Arthrobotrys musiformis TaxID=47236 RepID=A0AAV9WMZ8_9PEZI
MHRLQAGSALCLLLLAIGGAQGQETDTTTTIFETVVNTNTVTSKLSCNRLQLCDNLVWGSGPMSPAPGNGGPGGDLRPPMPLDPNFTPIRPTGAAPPGSTETGGMDGAFDFLLRGDGVLSEHFIAFDDNQRTVLVQQGKEPQYLQISSAGELGTSNVTEITEVVFLRITNGTLPRHRRQNDSEIYEIGDLLHATPSEVLETDKLSTFYFSGTVLKLNWKGLVYTFYAVPRNVSGEYSLKMARLGSSVPDNFVPFNLNYMPRPSSSTGSSTTSYLTTTPRAGIVPGTSSTTNSRSASGATSPSEGGSGSSESTSDSSNTDTGTGSGTDTDTDTATSKGTGTTTSHSNSHSSSTSIDYSAASSAYDIITSFSYQAFCSQVLEYTGTVSLVSTKEVSTPTGTVSTTSTSNFEKFIYTSTETIYTTTDTVTTDATALSRRGQYMISIAPEMDDENEPRVVLIPTPLLLATFNDAEISVGCASAVSPHDTSTERSTITETISYESTDISIATTTKEISTASPLTAVGPLELTVPVNGYWKITDESLTDYYGQYLTWIHDDLGGHYDQITQATASTAWFNMAWNATAGAYNPYFLWTYTTTDSATLVTTTVTEIKWLWYFINRPQTKYMLPMMLTETEAAAQDAPMHKAEFLVDSEGYATTKGEPVIYLCRWRGSVRAPGYEIYSFWGLRTGFLQSLKAAMLLNNDPDTEPYGCEIVSDSIKILAVAGESLGRD